MRLLVATPFLSSHYDAGLFFTKAFASEHTVYLWDYRQQKEPPAVSADATIVFKGESVDPTGLPKPVICYWPDALKRTPGIEGLLSGYRAVATPVRPTPEGMHWLPSGFDPNIHRDLGLERTINVVYIGTANSQHKVDFVNRIAPDLIYGNGWEGKTELRHAPPVYLHDFVATANTARILLDIHQDPSIGVNRKLFEMISCGFTLVDLVPGIEEIFSDYEDFTFTSPEEAKEQIKRHLKYEEDRESIWKEQRKAIARYSYERCAQQLLRLLRK